MKKMVKLRTDIRDLTLEELQAWLIAVGEKPYRAKQIFEWLYKKNAVSIDAMATLPAPLRDLLARDFILAEPPVVTALKAQDGTQKFLFQLGDDEKIETVLIPAAGRATVCVSTQAGCKFGCRFCASGIGGWKRDLDPSEILHQILHARREARGQPLTHIVFMGTGEPLDNYDNLLKAIRIINAPEGLKIAARRITVSTCGVIPKIQRLAGEGLQIELAISLHGFNDESRRVLMPVNKKYPMSELIEACREYVKKTKRQITFEYILIKDVTCTENAAEELRKLFRGLICKMNLIPYNKVAEFDHEPPDRDTVRQFQKQLKQFGVLSTVRTPRGRDVAAACGQLRHQAGKTAR